MNYSDLWALLIPLIIGIVIWIIFYILSSLGLMKIADKNGVRHSYLAWIPILNKYVLGKVAFKSTATTIIFFILSLVSSFSIYFGTISVGPTYLDPNTYVSQYKSQYGSYTVVTKYMPSSGLSLFICLIALIFYIMYMIALYKIYAKMSTKAVIMIICSIIFPILIPIFLFAIRKNPVRRDV